MDRGFYDRMDRPADNCPHCKAELDTAFQPGGVGNPDPGDVTICIYCARPIIFADDLSLRKPTAEEHQEIMGTRRIRRMISLVKKAGPRDPGRRRIKQEKGQ